MTIENLYGKKKVKLITCDNCGNGFEADSWEDAQYRMKQEGWVVRKVKGEWLNYCGDCNRAKGE